MRVIAMHIATGLTFILLLAASSAAAQAVEPLTSKEVDALPPSALAARLVPLMGETYTGKIRVTDDKDLPRVLQQIWLTGDMAWHDQGLCSAPVLVIEFDSDVMTSDAANFDPPLAPSHIWTDRRYAFVGAPRHHNPRAERNAAVLGLDCSVVPWPSSNGTFTAETGMVATSGINLLLAAKDAVRAPGSAGIDIACDSSSPPCGDMRAIIGRVGRTDIRHIATCHGGALPVPREVCTLIELGPNDATKPYPTGGLSGWWLRLERRDGKLSALFRAMPAGEDVFEWWTF
jgi:hypothetical protein